MSGGSYNYVSFRFEEFAEELQRRHPTEAPAQALVSHVKALADLVHAIEWADSGDTCWVESRIDERIRTVLGSTTVLATSLTLAEQAVARLQTELAALKEEAASHA